MSMIEKKRNHKHLILALPHMRIALLALLLNLCLPGHSQVLAPVDFSMTSAFSSSDLQLQLSHTTPGVDIYYTLNGNEPTQNDILYTGPITLQSRVGEPDSYAAIPTNPSLTFPFGTYTTSRANNRGWLPPYTESFKINVIRARAFMTGHTPSITSTHSYFIDPASTSKYTLPIVSLAVDSTYLFSADSGIYVYGNHPDGNYSQKGVDWERTGHIEMFDDGGNSILSQDIRLRMHGGGSRHSARKNLRLYGEYNGLNNFDVDLFDNTEQTQYKRLMIRAGGHRPDCLPRDDMANAITEGLNCDQQHFRRVILFINGEYWGIHSIKERVDNYFFQNQFGVDDNDITVLDQEYDVQSGGHAVDATMIENLETFMQNNDMTLLPNYLYVADRIDVDNYIDYMCSEIFLSNQDWVYSNVVLWRKTGPLNPDETIGHNGKFRWLMYDMDGAFGGSCSHAYWTVNTLEDATVETGLYTSYSRFFRGLLENPEFRNKFINRFNDLLNSWFREGVVINKMNEFHTVLSAEMMEHVNRWRYPSEATNLADRNLEIPSLVQWDTLFYHFRRFAERRPRKIREHVLAKWSISDTSRITVNVNDETMGRVQVNSILINDQIPGLQSSIYPWNGAYMNGVPLPLIAVPLPGYQFVEWQGSGITDDTLMWNPNTDTSVTAVFAPDNGFQNILINEVMPSNSNFSEDNFQQNDDWLELFNPNNHPVNLSGSHFNFNGTIWTIPNGTIIEAHDYLLFWNDKETYQGKNHTNFKLSNSQNTVYLIDPNGNTLDSLDYPATTSDKSYGRFPNGSQTFSEFDGPTPNMSNDLTGIDDLNDILELKIYPNPATTEVHFNKIISFQVRDITGRLIETKQQQKSLSLNNYSKGVYVITTTKGESKKFIIN